MSCLSKYCPMLLALGLAPKGWAQDCWALGAGGVICGRGTSSVRTQREGKYRGYNTINQLMQILQHVRHRFIGLNWDSEHLDPFLCSLCLWLCQLHAPLLEDVLRFLGKKGQVFLIPPVQPHYACIPASLELSTAAEIILFPCS